MLCTAATPVTVEVRGRDRRAVLRRRIRIVVAITITWNVVEAVVALSAGAVASSAALIGFGLDSIVEVLSAAAVAWQFAAPEPESREKVALRVIAVSFFALAAYVSVDAGRSLLGLREPEHSSVGIAIAALSLAVMPFLSWFERRTGRELGSASAVADSKQTLICTYLSAALLAGLLLNSLLGWAWADPVAALVIACFAVREGIEAWKGDACCAAPVAVLAGEHDREGCDDGCCAPVTLKQENPSWGTSGRCANCRSLVISRRAQVGNSSRNGESSISSSDSARSVTPQVSSFVTNAPSNRSGGCEISSASSAYAVCSLTGGSKTAATTCAS
ncbi:MAG: cation transporter [Cumulibacter sp.]